MEITSKNERRLYGLFMDRLEKLANEVGYFEEPQESEAYKKFLKAWNDYLVSCGIVNVLSHNIRLFNEEDHPILKGKFVLDDPMYLERRRLLIPEDFADRALVLECMP